MEEEKNEKIEITLTEQTEKNDEQNQVENVQQEQKENETPDLSIKDTITDTLNNEEEKSNASTRSSKSQNDEEEEPKPDTNSIETQIESTFPTTTEGMDILLASDEVPKIKKSGQMPKSQFIQILDNSPKPLPKSTVKKYKPMRYSSAAPLALSEVRAICDKLLAGKKVNVDDPSHLQDVLTEFSQRRLAALEQSEYLKIKKIDDITTQLKKQFASKDMEDLFLENLNQAKERTRQATEALEQVKQVWKQKEAEFKDKTKQEVLDLQKRQEYAQQDLEMKWTDPSIQRRFNKQSKVLLQQKAIEKYMALTGELEAAEELKKRNREAEKKEAQQKFSVMQSAYEADVDKLTADQEVERAQLVKEHEFQYQSLLKNRNEALEIAEKRLRFAQIQEQEAANNNNFASKKKVIAEGQPIPMAPIITKTVKLTPTPAPLPLPPLQVKHVKKRGHR